MQILEDIGEILAFRAGTLTASKFEIRPIDFVEQDAWSACNGALSHRSGGFFHVTGFRSDTTRREELVLYQPQGAFNGLLLTRQQDQIYVLVQARIEPGNVGVCQFGPTIQSTPANYRRLHGGRPTPCLEFFEGWRGAGTRPLGHSTQVDLGRRYFQKSKTLSFVECDTFVAGDSSMAWMPLAALFKLANEDHLLNTDLRSMLGVFDWDHHLGGALHTPRCEAAAALLDMVQGFETSLGRLVPVDALSDWEWTESGIGDRANRGPHVAMFSVRAENREVPHWAQPLWCDKRRGEVSLLMRQRHGQPEFLLSAALEFGIANQRIIQVTRVNYSDQPTAEAFEGRVFAEILQSEEGGRFYRDERRYRIIEVDDHRPGPEQAWVSLAGLKWLLKTSMRVSIELRVICSLLLPRLNPDCSHKQTEDAEQLVVSSALS